MHIWNICLNWGIVEFLEDRMRGGKGWIQLPVTFFESFVSRLKDATVWCCRTSSAGCQEGKLNWLLRTVFICFAVCKIRMNQCYRYNALRYCGYFFFYSLFHCLWVSYWFLLLREQSTQGPAESCIPRLNQRKEVSVMNSMLPQRSAVATLGYNSGKTTFKICFCFLVIFRWILDMMTLIGSFSSNLQLYFIHFTSNVLLHVP